MNATAYHLEARAPFHFGLRGVGIEATTVHGPSDTLFAALCYVLRQHFGLATLQNFLDEYAASGPPLVLSSAFPYVPRRHEEEVEGWTPPEPLEPEQVVRFYPRPLEPPPGVPDSSEDRKTVKGIAWVSEGIFRAWISGNEIGLAREWVPEMLVGGEKVRHPNLVQGRRIWLTAEERQHLAGWRDEETDAIRLWAVGDVPRVTVDRWSSASSVYQAGRLWFQAGGGLWLLVRFRDDWRERGEVALQVLGDAGIGGERSAGHGQYRLHGPHTLGQLPDPRPGERFLALSLYWPTEAEVESLFEGEGVSYRLIVRRGWMSSPDESRDAQGNVVSGMALRRKAVRMFSEGSILRWPNGGLTAGALADVTPDAFDTHRVWRCGLAYGVGYRLEGGRS